MITAPSRPLAVAATQWLFVLLAVMWMAFAAITAVRQTGGATAALILAVLMVINAALLFWLGWGIGKRSRTAYLLALAYLAANLVLSISDDFGLSDLFGLALTLAPFVLLLATRNHYLRSQEQPRP